MQSASPEPDGLGFDPANDDHRSEGGSVSIVHLVGAEAGSAADLGLPIAAEPADGAAFPAASRQGLDDPQPPQHVAAAAAPVSGRLGLDGVDLDQLLRDRPDVLQSYYSGYYGSGNDPHSHAWEARVGGTSLQDYAAHWYRAYGITEGYSQAGGVQNQPIDVDQLLHDRPDVFQGFFSEYYGPHNDRNSSAWVDRVGGDTVQDYARYWYVTYGRQEGYGQTPDPPQAGGVAAPGAPAPDGPVEAPDPAPDAPPRPEDANYHAEDPSLDPWNHPAIYGDDPGPDDILAVGQGLGAPDPLG